ncbi:hypothetical protein GCM10023153_24410 [Ornithinibacter aureus]|uniref:Uncharacterized protein n=1 Tax=Ornithinibacter aureus TaxID=622664 RepID=A0ABP8K0L2_9MICO
MIAWLSSGCGSGARAYEPAAGGPIVSTFTVPTYAWDKGAGADASVSGTLWFTAEGCTLMSNGEGADRVTEAVFFPNATGVTYGDGVRAVVDAEGRVFAVEGQDFAYGGGFGVPAASDLRKQWLDQCPGTEVREGAVINDEPASPPSTISPPLPAQPGPTAPSTAAELGYFPVPTYQWQPDGGGPDFVTGTVTFADGRCPVMTTSQGDDVQHIGLVFPNAEGFRHAQHAPRPVIYSTLPSGNGGLMVEDEQLTGFHGRTGSSNDSAWAALCTTVPVDSVFSVQDFPNR